MGPKLQEGRWLSKGSVPSQQDTPRAGLQVEEMENLQAEDAAQEAEGGEAHML